MIMRTRIENCSPDLDDVEVVNVDRRLCVFYIPGNVGDKCCVRSAAVHVFANCEDQWN